MPRRANLAGKLRSDGKWEIRVTLTRLDGAKIRKSIYGATQAEAQYKAHQLIYESRREVSDDAPLSELADLWRTSWPKNPNTRRSYEYGLSLVLPRLGKKPVVSIRIPDITKAVLASDTDRKAKLIRTTMSQLLNYAALLGIINGNPLSRLRLPRSYTPARRRMTMEDLADVLRGMDEDKRLFFEFLADTGLRPWKEAVALERSAIGYRSDEYFVKVGDSKTDSGRGRVVPILDAKIAHALMSKEGALFQSRSTYKRAWVSGFPIYALRALAISRWCEKGLDLDVIKMRAGHSQIKLTLDIYNEVQKERILTGVGVGEGVRVSDIMNQNGPF